MAQTKKKTNEVTYTKDEVRKIVADVLSDLPIILKDPSLVIAGLLAMRLLEDKLK